MKQLIDNQGTFKAKNVALWALQILTAAVFLMSGFARLSGEPRTVEMFDQVGVGQWFRYVTGGIEVASAVLLLIPRLTPVGAALLACTMAGAVLAQLLFIGGSPVPPLVLLCFAVVILWGRFRTVKAWLRKLRALAVPSARTSAKEGAHVKVGDVFENPVTGERAVIRIGTEQNDGKLLVADLYIRPGGAVMGEHIHPALEERFTVLHGRVAFRLSGRTSTAGPGVTVVAPPGTPHDWWNAGEEQALVRVEVRPGARFAAFIANAFGLAQDGRVDRHGMPKLLQLALFAREFDDVIQFTRPPRVVQRVLFGSVSPLARLLGYRGSYPKYSTRGRSDIVTAESANVAAVPVPVSQ